MDTSSCKDVLVLNCPSDASGDMRKLWEDQLLSLSEIQDQEFAADIASDKVYISLYFWF